MCAALEGTVLVATQRPGRTVPVQQLRGTIFIAVIDHRPIVAAEDHDRILVEPKIA